jgi:hypothetical protein
VPILKYKSVDGKLRLVLYMCKRERRANGLHSKILLEIENLIYGTDNLRQNTGYMSWPTHVQRRDNKPQVKGHISTSIQ